MRRDLAICAPLALAMLVVVAAHDDHERPSLVTVAGTLLALLVLIGVQGRSRSFVAGLLSSTPLRRLGELSYSIYLWNVLARIAVLSRLGHTVLGDVVWVAMFMALATLSFRYVERPLRTKLGGERHDPRALPAVHRLPG